MYAKSYANMLICKIPLNKYVFVKFLTNYELKNKSATI